VGELASASHRALSVNALHACVLPSGIKVLALPSGELAARPIIVPSELRETAKRAPVIEPNEAPFPTLQSLCTGDAHIAATVERLQRVANADVCILLEGETGTGKEWFARAIHAESNRANKPFVALNCASIPEGLIESELFGYEEGAFTGARRRGQIGKVLQANGGTLFLDEIGDMPLSMQARLLRMLQERVVTPLGTTRTQAVDIKVIGATHRKLRTLIEEGKFRDDLYYRLNGLTVRLPALRDRTDRVAVTQKVLGALGCGAWQISPQVLDLFERHRWPGNLRQLSNVLRTAIALAGKEREIRVAHLPDDFHDDVAPMAQTVAVSVAAPAETPAPKSIHEFEKEAVRQALERQHGNVSAACRELGISRNTFYRRLKGSAHS
jgi:sigma-54 dependent transcriptional regulator, acetoin dehydrogenase operon transcriptional activator AcoR